MSYLENLTTIEIVILSLVVFVLIFVLTLIIQVRRIRRIQKSFLSGRQGANLEELILEHDASLQRIVEELKTLSISSGELGELQQFAIQGVGVVRFNMFGETGGNNSFALALLDGRRNGVVITALGRRDSQRIFVKSIQDGGSKIPLTEEEKQAILVSQRGESDASASTTLGVELAHRGGEVMRIRHAKTLKSKK